MESCQSMCAWREFQADLQQQKSGRNTKGLLLCKDLVEDVIEVIRKSDRIISLKLGLNGENITVVSAYVPQVGCADDEKEQFWQDLFAVTAPLDGPAAW